MAGRSREGKYAPQFRRTLRFLRPHLRPLIIGLIAALGVSVFYTFSISSVIPLLKVIFSQHETLPDWLNRIETERRLNVVIADNMPDNPVGLLIDHVRPESRSRGVLNDNERIVSIAGEAPGAYGIMRLLAQFPDRELSPVTVMDREGNERVVELTLRGYHWWSSVLKRVTGFLPKGKDADSRLSTLGIVMLALVIVTFLGGVCRLANEGLVATAVQRGMHDLRTRLADHVLRLPVSWHGSQQPGDTLSRFATDLSKVEIGLMTLFGKVISEPLKATGVVVLTLMIEWRLLVVALAGVPIGVIAIRWFGKAVKRSQKRASESWGRLLDHLGERIAGIRVVKAYGMQEAESRRFSDEGRELTRAQTSIEVVDAATKPVLEVLAVCAVAAFVLYGGTRVFNNDLEPHLFFAAVVCLGGLYDPVRRLGNVNNRLAAADASATRLYQLLDLRPEEPSSVAGPAREIAPLSDRIEFHEVSFTYPARPERPALDRVSLSAERGQIVALVGPNGCGKTTLMSMLMRFYEPDSGSITIDGQDIADLRLESLRGQIGLVTQDAVIFSGTIAENIAYGAVDVDAETIERAARLAHVDDFIRTLRVEQDGQTTSGYDAYVTARSLSGGQRQRIALARAILRDPSILILDEATSQIDSESERKIQEAIDDVTRGRTTFIIAHRYSTISRADSIVVMNEGRVIAHDRHETLLHTCPFYVSLCQTQFAVAPASPA